MRPRLGTFYSTWTSVDGRAMHAKVSVAPTPPADAPTVVLVHGLGMSHRYLMPTAERLAPLARVLVPDLPGFGKSIKPESILDLPAMADSLADWMRASGVERATLLGNSIGCSIVTECSVRHPDLVERAVLQSPVFQPEQRTTLHQIWNWCQNSLHEPISLLPVTLREYHDREIWRIWKTFQDTLTYPIEETLPQVRQPTLVVRGSLDSLCPSAWAEQVTRLLPDGRLRVIPGGSHTLVFSAPLELSRVVRPFLHKPSPTEDERG